MILYTSTLQHRLWVGSSLALLCANLVAAVPQLHAASDWAAAGIAALFGYVLSDFLSGMPPCSGWRTAPPHGHSEPTATL